LRWLINIFITGGNGFLGRNLIKKLTNNINQVISPASNELDLRNYNDFGLYNSLKYDLIFHLAAWTQAGDFASKFPGSQWINNQRLNSNVVSWWREFQPQAYFISIGTSCSYASESNFEESSYLDGLPHGDLLVYGYTKRMVYLAQSALQKEFGLKSLVAVPSTLYGQGYEINNRQPHFIFDLIKKCLNYKYFQIPIEIWGNGKQKREIIFVDDFVDNLLQLVGMDQTGLVNIGSGEEHEILYYLDQVAKICGLDNYDIKFKLDAYIGVLSKKLSVDKIMNTIPNVKKTSLEKGLRLTIEDIESRYYKNNIHS